MSVCIDNLNKTNLFTQNILIIYCLANKVKNISPPTSPQIYFLDKVIQSTSEIRTIWILNGHLLDTICVRFWLQPSCLYHSKSGPDIFITSLDCLVMKKIFLWHFSIIKQSTSDHLKSGQKVRFLNGKNKMAADHSKSGPDILSLA